MILKTILADDHQIVREGLKSLLNQEPDVEVIGEAQDGREAIRLVNELKPDIIVMDISMPNLNGIEATRQIVSDHPSIKVIALSMHHDKQFVSNMLEAGASGFLLKDCAADELIDAIHTVIGNRTYLSPDIANVVLTDYIHKLRTNESALNILSSREREVLQLLVEGKSTKEISDILFISVKTVETHRQQIMKKTGIHNIAELTKFAIREGLTSV